MLQFICNRLKEALGVPDKITGYNRTTATGMEALMITLRRLAYPCRWFDLIPIFNRSKPELSIIFSSMVHFLENKANRLLTDLNQVSFRI